MNMVDLGSKERVIKLVREMGSVGGLDAEAVIGLLDFVPGNEDVFVIALSTAKIATMAREAATSSVLDHERLLNQMEVLGLLKR